MFSLLNYVINFHIKGQKIKSFKYVIQQIEYLCKLRLYRK